MIKSKGTLLLLLLTLCLIMASTSKAASVISPKLSYSFSGNGHGAVSFNTSGTSCGAKCSSYPINSVVTLEAKPSLPLDSDFISWTGCTSSTGTQCTVTLTANKIVKANFALYPKLKIISITNRGTVTSPAGINCGATCSLSQPRGTVIALIGTATPGYYFSSWTGACSAQTCSVTLSENKTVHAVFLPEIVTPLTIGYHVNVVDSTKK